jgi:hypothetical protein
MPQILAPRLELFRRFASFQAKPDQRVSQTVRLKVRQARPLKRFPEDGPNRRGRAPMAPFQPCRFKLARPSNHYSRCRKQRIVIAPQLLFS